VRARRVSRLRYSGRCADCGAELAAGAKARLYKHRGQWVAYGTECHDRQGRTLEAPPVPLQVELDARSIEAEADDLVAALGLREAQRLVGAYAANPATAKEADGAHYVALAAALAARSVEVAS
jgi:hypothetical protein